MEYVIYASLYVIGYVVSYKLHRHNMSMLWGYTQSDRVFNLFVSLFSWVSVLYGLICFQKKNDKPVKW